MIRLTDETFEIIVMGYSQIIFRVAYSYTKNIFDADDIVQEVFLKLYRARKVFENEEHIKNWLIRVAINHSLDLIRRKQREMVIDTEYINNLPDTSDAVEKNEVIKECVLSLKDSYKTIIILHYYDDYSIKEISDILKISENSVKVRLNRARNKLKVIINERKDKNGKR